MSVEEERQELHADNIVELFTLDTTPIGGIDIFRFTAMSRATTEVVFDGNTYVPIDIEMEGFLWDGRGPFPKPKMRVSNVAGLLSAAVIASDDLIGSTLTRIRTFEMFLDDGSAPDPTAIFPLDVYVVEQKTRQNKVFIEWVFSSSLDQAGRFLPGRQVIRDRCTHEYRIYDNGAGSFDYTSATCPYVGAASFDRNGVSTTDPNDDCGRKLSDCKLRFGDLGELPTRAFPGVARTRVQ